jgi:hypothetical protein
VRKTDNLPQSCAVDLFPSTPMSCKMFLSIKFPHQNYYAPLFYPIRAACPARIRGCSWDNPRKANWKTVGGDARCLAEILSRSYPGWTEEGGPMTHLEFEPGFSRRGPKLHGFSGTAARSLNSLGYLTTE